MKYPKCQFENEEGAKFCSSCGHRLELLCPECGKLNKHGSRFCNACGHQLEDIRTKEKPIPPSDSERKYVIKEIKRVQVSMRRNRVRQKLAAGIYEVTER